jgi:branched-chain amino acid transport system permease protein
VFTFDSITVLIVAPLAIAGLVWFLRGTGFGLAARAAAEDGDRARLLGIPVKRVSLLVWMIAGFLSALTAILRAPVAGFQLGAIGGFTLLMQALTAAVVARMESLPIAFGAAVLIGTMDQVVFFGTSNESIFNGVLLGIVIVALLLQRRRVGRLAGDSSSWQAIQEVRPIPRELRSLREVRVAKYGAGALGVAIVAAIPFVLTPSRTSLVSVMMIYAIVGLSLVILTGWSGNVSFGQWAIAGVGGLVAQRLATQANPLDFFLILLIVGLVGAAVALLIGIPALRIQGLFLGVTTLAFAVAAGSWIFNFKVFHASDAVQRPVLFGLWDVSKERQFYFVCFGFLLLALVFGRNLRRARFGRVLIAMRDNPRGAQSLGVPFIKTKLVAFAASGFLAAIGGGLYAYHEQQLRADRFPAELSLVMFSLVVIGGMGSQAGAILGAIYVEGAQYFLPREFTLLATGFGVLVLLLFFPGGLGQLFYGARDAFLRSVARRRGVLVPSLVADSRVDLELADAALAATGETALSAEEVATHELAGHPS